MAKKSGGVLRASLRGVEKVAQLGEKVGSGFAGFVTKAATRVEKKKK